MPDKDLIEEMIRYYDDRTDVHDQLMSYKSKQQHEQNFSDIIKLIKPSLMNKNVLEIASGTGNWTSILADYAESVVAVDTSIRSIEKAKLKLKEYDNIQFQQLDILKEYHQKTKFDFIFSADFISHIPYQSFEQYLKNLKNITKNDSTVIHLDISFHEYFQKEKSTIDKFGNRVSIRELPNGESYKVVKNFPDKTKLDEIFKPYFSSNNFLELPHHKRWIYISKT